MPNLHETIIKRKRRITVLISGSGSNLQALLDAAGTSALPSAEITFVLSSRSNAYGLIRASTHIPPIPTSICALKTFLTRNPGSTREDYDAEIARRVLESRPDIVVLAGWMHILSDSFLDILNGVKEAPKAPALPPPPPAALPTQTEPIPSSSPTAAEEGIITGLTAVSIDAVSSISPGTQNTTDTPAASSTTSTSTPTTASTAVPSTASPTSTTTAIALLPLTFPIPCINLHPALPGAFDGANAIGRAFEAFKKGEISKTGCMVHRVVREVDRGQPLIVREVEIKEGDNIQDLEQRIHKAEHEIIVEGTRKVLQELDEEGRP